MIDDKVCAERMASQDEKISVVTTRLNNHSERLKTLELAQIGLEKDHGKFLELLERFEKAVDKLTKAFEEFKEKPLKEGEATKRFIINTILGILIGYFFAQILGG